MAVGGERVMPTNSSPFLHVFLAPIVAQYRKEVVAMGASEVLV